MKTSELLKNTFKALHQELGHNRPCDMRPFWQRRLSTASVFCQALVSNGYMTEAQMQQAAQRYRLGMSRNGGVIFWQYDENDVMRDGKIMFYRPDCHRDHDRHPTWVTHLLRRNGYLPEDWKSEHCLFGLHLCHTDLADSTDIDSCSDKKSVQSVSSVVEKTICVVESEKTAVIMSAVKPDFIWLATGGKTELNVAKLKPLAGHKVILFPDTDETGQTYSDWFQIAEAASDVFGHPITVSSILEQHATPAQKAAKIDIADLLFPQS